MTKKIRALNLRMRRIALICLAPFLDKIKFDAQTMYENAKNCNHLPQEMLLRRVK